MGEVRWSVCLVSGLGPLQWKQRKGTAEKKKKGAKDIFSYLPESIITLHKATVLKLLELIKDLSLQYLSNRKCSSHKAINFQRSIIFKCNFLRKIVFRVVDLRCFVLSKLAK